MNKSDSERIATVLKSSGYSPTPNRKEADLVVINVCSIRQSALDRVYGLISNIKNKKSRLYQGLDEQIKTQIKNQKIILTGCILPKDKEKLKNKVDLIFDINQLTNLPQMLSQTNTNLSRHLAIKEFDNLAIKQLNNYLSIKPCYSTFPFAYLPIMTGCNNFCTYCVVPYTRGREVSRPVEEIICEVKELIKRGYKKIILLGQNVNSYKSKTPNSKLKKVNFPKLLKIVNNLPGDFWLTFITSHPQDFSDELIETMTKCEKVMPYLHLPVQSGDNQVLKKMNRHYTVAHYKELIKKIREKFAKIREGFEKNICISTDIIVGFPGETKKQFAQTARLMREIKFDMAYIAKYSPRPGTAATKLKDNIPLKEKEKRWKILAKILEKTALKNNKKYLNKTVEVLIEKQSGNSLYGQTKTFKNVKVYSPEQKITGEIVEVKIKKISPWGLAGELIKN